MIVNMYAQFIDFKSGATSKFKSKFMNNMYFDIQK